jgi:hypothetical protein
MSNMVNSTVEMIKPHSAFEVVTPDTVAECWNGVDDELYRALWNCTSKYEEVDTEDCGPGDVVGINSVSDFWAEFSHEQQVRLNELAKAESLE